MEEKELNQVQPAPLTPEQTTPITPETMNAAQLALRINSEHHPARHMWSDTQFEIIKKYIQAYEQTLNPDEEIGICLTQFGQSTIMQVTEITYERSVTLIFSGLINGEPSILIQHISQLNFLLTKIKKKVEEPPKPRRPIGFVTHDYDEDENNIKN